MKTKVIIVITVVVIFTISVASTTANKYSKRTDKQASSNSQAKGLAMEDRDQFK